MGKGPRGKRIVGDGALTVAAKNANGSGSVYFERPSRRGDGTVIRVDGGRATSTEMVDAGSCPLPRGPRPRRNEQPCSPTCRGRRCGRAASPGQPPLASLPCGGWDTVARHRVKASTLDSYRKFTSYLVDDLGPVAVVDVGAETLSVWQSALLDRFAPFTVQNCRKVCRQVFTEAVKVGLIAANPFDLVKAPPARRVNAGRALTPEGAPVDHCRARPASRGGGHLVVQSGLARERGAGTGVGGPRSRRGDREGAPWRLLHAVRGMVLGTTKTAGAEGTHHLAPVAIAQLRARRVAQAAERLAAGAAWQTHTYDGQPVSLVFTTATGGSSTDKPSPRQSPAPPRSRASSPRVSPPTPGDEPSSPPSTPTVASTSPTSRATSAIPTRPRPPDMSAIWERDPSTPPAAPPNSSTPALPADHDDKSTHR